jgi:ribosome-binding protein aMBF1 (putative translation factor)
LCYRIEVWTVVVHPQAEAELDALPAKEGVAVMHAIEKLVAAGPALPFPHQSGLKGAEGLQLRPRGGRRQWRPGYGRVGEAFVIAAVGPEALVNARGFRRAVTTATNGSTRSKSEEVHDVKPQPMRSRSQVNARQLKDPAFRAEWERTAVARAVAVRLVEYRGEHALSQTALARKLGMKQPAIARLEAGEHNPSFDTLARLSTALGIEFHISVTPAGVAI